MSYDPGAGLASRGVVVGDGTSGAGAGTAPAPWVDGTATGVGKAAGRGRESISAPDGASAAVGNTTVKATTAIAVAVTELNHVERITGLLGLTRSGGMWRTRTKTIGEHWTASELG